MWKLENWRVREAGDSVGMQPGSVHRFSLPSVGLHGLFYVKIKMCNLSAVEMHIEWIKMVLRLPESVSSAV